MKRNAYLCFFVAYFLVCCTVISAWVEKQMTLTGRVITRHSSVRNSTMEIPLWQAWYDGNEYHLFCVQTMRNEDGVEREVVCEISDHDYSIRADGVIDYRFIGECRILYAASRYPSHGETVFIREEETVVHPVLVCTKDGSSLNEPSGGNVETLAISDSARLLRVPTKTPFIEKELTHILFLTDDPWTYLHAIDLSDVKMFLDALPCVCTVVLLMVIGLGWALWAWGCNCKRLLILPLVIPVGIWLLLRGCNLPSSLLPNSSILDVAHYRSIQTAVARAFSAPYLKVLLGTSIRQARIQCVFRTMVAVLVTLIPALTIYKHHSATERANATK